MSDLMGAGGEMQALRARFLSLAIDIERLVREIVAGYFMGETTWGPTSDLFEERFLDRMNFRGLVANLEAIVKAERNGLVADFPECDRFLELLNKTRERRNRFAHDPLIIDSTMDAREFRSEVSSRSTPPTRMNA